MFQRLLNLFRRERCLFHYWDGKRKRSVDPVATWRKLWTHDVDFLAESERATNPKREDGGAFYTAQDVYEAEDKLRSLTRDLFDVKEWTETQPGLTVDETDELLTRFVEFCGDIKKKRSLSPMPSVPSESMEQPVSTATASYPSECVSASYSTPSESNAAAPTGP